MPEPLWTRIRHDADELRRLGDWLLIIAEEKPDTIDAIALDYFRLAAHLNTMRSNAQELALSMTRVIP